MKRTTIYLPPDLEARLKTAARRENRPMAEIIRESVQRYLASSSPTPPPHLGAFDSGHADTAERTEELLAETGFAEE